MNELLSLSAFLDSLKRRWWIAVLMMGAGSMVSFWLMKRLPRIYQASTLILVEPQKIPVAYVRPTVTTSVETRLRSIQQQITSRTRLERVIEDLKLFPELVGRIPMENLVSQVAAHIKLEVRGTSTFRIYYEGTNAKEVAAVVNKLADLFIAENTQAREREARSTSLFLEEELAKVKERLEYEEAQIAEFKKNHMGELPEQREANLRTLDTLQNRLRGNNEAMTRTQDRRVALETQLASIPAAGVTDVNQVALQLDQARGRLVQLLGEYTEQHPEVALQKREIARLEQLMSSQTADTNAAPRPGITALEARLRTDLDAANSEIKALTVEQVQIRKDIASYQLRVENAPKNEAALSTLTRDYDNLRMNYQSLLNKKIEAKLAENLERERQGEQFTIVDRAVPPAAPYKPNLTQILALGTVIGLLAGCAAPFALDLLRPRFRTEEELVAAFGVPVLASIPLIQSPDGPRRAWGLKRLGSGAGAALSTLLRRRRT